MKAGYKKSKIGIIPDLWEVSTLGDLTETIKDGTHGTHKEFAEGIPLLSAKDIKNGKILVPNDCRKITQDDFNSIHKNFRLRTGDLLLTVVGTIGRVAILTNYQDNFTFQRSVGYIRLKPDHDVNFFSQYFQSTHFVKQLELRSNASAQAGVYLGELAKVVVPILPKKEQEKIASILSAVDEKIDLIDQQIAETEELKRGMMQRLLTKGIGHTKFKDSPLGKIPESWEVKELGSIATIKGRIGYRGYTKADLVDKGKGALTIGGAQISRGNKLNLSKTVYINWDKYEESPEIKISEGDIIFAQRGTLGRTALIESLNEAATINPSMVLIKDISCNKKFLYYYLCSNHVQKIVFQISTATAVPMISQKQINAFSIAVPSVKEQEKIVEILSSLDSKLNCIIQRKKSFKNLKKGLMQQLLTGKIRVKLD